MGCYLTIQISLCILKIQSPMEDCYEWVRINTNVFYNSCTWDISGHSSGNGNILGRWGELEEQRMNLKSLEENRRFNGMGLKLVKRGEKRAIYEIEGGTHYEVVRIGVRRVSETSVVHGFLRRSDYTHYEAYPPSEEWGVNGWTYRNLGDAQKRYGELI